MATFASETSVSPERSRAEVERTLRKYGAEKYMYGQDQDRAIICFEMKGRRIRFDLPMPDKSERRFTHTPGGTRRSPGPALEAWEKGCRQRWRALAAGIKMKLEFIESGITEFDSEFLSHIVLPDQRTVGQWMIPQVEEVYATGDMPEMLPGSGQRALAGTAIDAECREVG